MELLLLVPGGPARGGASQGTGQKNLGGLGIRWTEAGWSGHERCSGLLQPCSPSHAARGLGRGAAGFLQSNLPNRAIGEAGRSGGVLPVRYSIFFFHHAALQYVGRVRPGEFFSGSFQRKNFEGLDGR